ncbi:hypothetical protein [Bifidobacterium sp. SO4]|uniref:hypothetical protein n=1 Tax=Bifidobacterium sp. SO4 TaxID=2809030 RepID=UPI001BDD7736|nr:hypothetical protein [Bifidobacterium sp. SO4]MBT1171264.1 hypothetical protein [Bifidobacterium sp. SO4]
MYRLEAYDTMNGVHLNKRPIPFTSCSWSESWNAGGDMSVRIPMSRDAEGMDLDGLLVEQATLLALWDGDRIVHAGPIMESPEWDAETQVLSVKCGDGWNLFDWRLVLDTRLRSMEFDGPITVDDDNPSSEWVVGYAGSGGDIIKGLIGLAQSWGRLCVNVPIGYEPQTGGSPLSLSWAGWDFTTMSQAFSDVLDSANGGQLRFDPQIQPDGRFRWQARWAQNGLTDHEWMWNTLAPRERIRFLGVASGGEPIINQVWASGGKNSDQLLMARADDTDAQTVETLLQAGSGSASSNGSLAALHAYAKSTLSASRRDRVWKLQAHASHQVRVGDHVALRVNDGFIHERATDGTRVSSLIPLVITDISGDVSGEWLDIQARQYAASIDGIRPGNTNPVAWLANRMDRLSRMTAMALAPSGTQAYGTVGKIRELFGRTS